MKPVGKNRKFDGKVFKLASNEYGINSKDAETIKSSFLKRGYKVRVTRSEAQPWVYPDGRFFVYVRAPSARTIKVPIKKDKTRMKKYGHFMIEEDRMGNITLGHTYSPKTAFFQSEADKEAIYDLLKKDEKESLLNGWAVDVYDSEPRASVFQEIWEASAGR